MGVAHENKPRNDLPLFFKAETSQVSNTTFSLDPLKKMIGTCQKLQLGTLKRYFRNNAIHTKTGPIVIMPALFLGRSTRFPIKICEQFYPKFRVLINKRAKYFYKKILFV